MRVARRADSGGEVFGEGASISLPNPLAGGEGAASPLPTSKGVAVGAAKLEVTWQHILLRF